MNNDGINFYRRTAPLQNFFHERELNQLTLQHQLNRRTQIDSVMQGRYNKHLLNEYWHNLTSNEKKNEERNRQLLQKLNELESQTSAMIVKTEKLQQMKDEYFTFLQHHFAVSHIPQSNYQLTSPSHQFHQQSSSHVDSPEGYRMQENSEQCLINGYGNKAQQSEQNQRKITESGLLRTAYTAPHSTKIVQEVAVQTEGFCCVFCGSDLAQRTNFSYLNSQNASQFKIGRLNPLEEMTPSQIQPADHFSQNVQYMQTSNHVQNRNADKRYHRSNSCDITSDVQPHATFSQNITRPQTSFGELCFRHDIIVTDANSANIANNQNRISYKNEINSGQVFSNSIKATKARDSELSSDLTLDDDSLLCSSSSEEAMLDREDTIRYIKQMCELDKARTSKPASQRSTQKSTVNQNLKVTEQFESKLLLQPNENKYVEDVGSRISVRTPQKDPSHQSNFEYCSPNYQNVHEQNPSLALPVRPKSKLQKAAHVHSPLASSVSENTDEQLRFREESSQANRHNLMEFLQINEQIDIPNFKAELHLADKRIIQEHMHTAPIEKKAQSVVSIANDYQEIKLQKTDETLEQMRLQQNIDNEKATIQDQTSSNYLNKDKIIQPQENAVVSGTKVASNFQSAIGEETNLVKDCHPMKDLGLPDSGNSEGSHLKLDPHILNDKNLGSKELSEQAKLNEKGSDSKEIVSSKFVTSDEMNLTDVKANISQSQAAPVISENKENFGTNKKDTILASTSESEISDKEDSFFDEKLTATSAYQLLLGNTFRTQTSKTTTVNSDTDDELEGELAAAVSSENTQKQEDSKILNTKSASLLLKEERHTKKTDEMNNRASLDYHSNEDDSEQNRPAIEAVHSKGDSIQNKGGVFDPKMEEKIIENAKAQSVEDKKPSEGISSKKPVAPESVAEKTEPDASINKAQENRKKFVRTRSKAHGLSKAARKALNLDPDSESDEEPSLALRTSIKKKSAGSDSDDFDFYD